MAPAASTRTYPLRAFDAAVVEVRDLSPHFRRLTFAGPALATFGVPGPTVDLRIKLLLPTPGHPLTPLGSSGGQLQEGWYQEWLRRDQPGRGFIRSYTVRALRDTPQGRVLDVDFVIHPVEPGQHAPASEWAQAAVPGTPVVLIGPDLTALAPETPSSEAGIRWDPQGAAHVLLAGDETAVPAISSILENLPPGVDGHAFLEVPETYDAGTVTTASSVRVTWLPRKESGAGLGQLLNEAVRALTAGLPLHAGAETYAWVTAEASVVREIRRHLVQAVGLDPKRSEFRGYWSLGKAGSGANGTPIVPAS
ncbi:siderophore-interacting protein [Pseudarthrobacter sp. J75]|uniref:siderophore-interacting protein n=1 Tax=unclassified Pseudarthrobacter TaxID=2647000 RepID=UPI002E818075|nr:MULTISPECIES: siderophore-interacting protein [unclassified Pseudarthrobacter]MEE2523980.1 siderophore-interacting protein [Pseudarthrobacter sp. J47]MEE2528252.1 siderophore-interacting protein [Pseudarthrobacter sp. J75]